uniref:Transcriptional regulator, CadC n=1 Tax=Solibacter usitatus (strain Ellin6076) TaxID=234267 RepID=Q01QR8_SOLUE
MAAPQENGRIRFGAFDFDPLTRQLRREGTPVRLQPQPAQVLGLLLASPGEIVTRDTLRTALWGTQTVVDFDRGLNFCVAQIRLALGDSSDSPRYIKTLPKRGYQFIAPVASPPAAAPPNAKPRRSLIALACAIPLLVVAIFLILRNSAPPAPRRVAVARFENQTGDPSLDRVADALTDAVIVELASAGEHRLDIIGNAAILRQPRPQHDLLAIHAALHVDYILLGSLQRNPNGLQAFIQFITLPGQNHIKVARLPADSPELPQRIVKTILTVFPKP